MERSLGLPFFYTQQVRNPLVLTKIQFYSIIWYKKFDEILPKIDNFNQLYTKNTFLQIFPNF
jgi:hypothetical protein